MGTSASVPVERLDAPASADDHVPARAVVKEARWVRIWAAIALLTSGCADTTGGAGDSGAEADADRDAGGGDSGSALDAGSEGGTVADAGTDGGASGSDASHAPDAAACPARPYLGFFVWNDDLVTTRDAILDLAQGAGVTEIYLHANLFYAGDETETTLAAWIDAAHARCIDVDLLFGNASWIHPAGRAQASARADWAVAFAAAHPGSRPTGVHFDLEPQQLAEWSDTTTHPALVSELVDTLTAIRPAADASGLVLSVDTGFFLDGVMVTRSGTTRPGSEWVTDAVTRLVVMDYRDSAASMGHGGMISLAQDEVDYAAAHGTPVVLAAETNPISPEYVSFAEEGRAAMFVEFDLVRAHFASAATFAGVAVHDRDGLAALGP